MLVSSAPTPLLRRKILDCAMQPDHRRVCQLRFIELRIILTVSFHENVTTICMILLQV